MAKRESGTVSTRGIGVPKFNQEMLAATIAALAGITLVWTFSQPEFPVPVLIAAGAVFTVSIVIVIRLMMDPDSVRALQSDAMLQLASSMIDAMGDGLTEEASQEVCELLLPNTSAIAVALTNCESVLGYAGYQEAHNPAGIAIRTSATHECIRRGKTLVLLTPEATGIREVTIRAPRLSFRGDTVSYNVSRFTEAQDRSIADVLRKMPGIEVAKSGEIRYNGQPINNFYIEGLDMLDGRYGQATNNIAPQDVASVEVMENHQPIKALKDIVFSDRAAINLRLKPHAKARWTGTLRGGAGWSPALWNGALFAMRIGARGQSMVNLKTDNTGQNPSAETERLSVEDILNGGANDYNPAAHLSVGTSSAPLDDTRTRFNRSHMASLNNLRKLSEDYQLSSSLTWGYDRLASDRAARQSWYLADGTRVDTEQESAASCRQQLSARIALKANTERFYMLEKTRSFAGMERPPCRALGQLPQPPACRGPGLRHRKRPEIYPAHRHTFAHRHLLPEIPYRPQSLDVVRETGQPAGQTHRRPLLFHMQPQRGIGTQAGQFAFAFKGGVSALFRGLVTDLTGTGLGQAPRTTFRPATRASTSSLASPTARSGCG